jgi:hypothetical protein
LLYFNALKKSTLRRDGGVNMTGCAGCHAAARGRAKNSGGRREKNLG